MRRSLLLVLLLAALAVFASGCGGDDDDAAGTTTAAETTGGDDCAKDQLDLTTTGKLTIGTDNPAFPPWFDGGSPKGSKWEINDPSKGQGFEGAVAYAVAKKMGFAKNEVAWV